MSCPSCGGSSRELISPGYYACTSIITTRQWGAGQAHPALGPEWHEQHHVCGRRYQEGRSGLDELCGCSTAAIGRCADCSVAVCGDHSRLHNGRRLCIKHIDEIKAVEMAALKARQKAEAEALGKARSDEQSERLRLVSAFLKRMSDAGNPGLREFGSKYRTKDGILRPGQTRYSKKTVARGWQLPNLGGGRLWNGGITSGWTVIVEDGDICLADVQVPKRVVNGSRRPWTPSHFYLPAKRQLVVFPIDTLRSSLEACAQENGVSL